MITKEDLLFIQNYPIIEKEVQMQLDHLRDKVGIHSAQLDRIVVQGGERHDQMAEYVSKIDELEHKYMDTLLNYKERYLRFIEAISALPQGEAQIIIMKYQKGYNWKRIIRETNYSESHVYRLHREALEHLGICPNSQKMGNV